MNPKKHKDQKSQYGILSANSLIVTTGIQGLQIILLSCAWKVIFTLRTHNPRNMSISFTRLSENQLKDTPQPPTAATGSVHEGQCKQSLRAVNLNIATSGCLSQFVLVSFVEGRKAVACFLCEWAISVCRDVFTNQAIPVLFQKPNYFPSLLRSAQLLNQTSAQERWPCQQIPNTAEGRPCTPALMPAKGVKPQGDQLPLFSKELSSFNNKTKNKTNQNNTYMKLCGFLGAVPYDFMYDYAVFTFNFQKHCENQFKIQYKTMFCYIMTHFTVPLFWFQWNVKNTCEETMTLFLVMNLKSW